ncbi:unnamed protein product [Allacma fusca]|uniref:Cilia- and flagella-associated protein 157 n=1 Tax=Allacma fusca TaxID=39272 RepID=A0A8J2NUU5_9HEXA|nr:unnamed protein product [Allacma fusca]
MKGKKKGKKKEEGKAEMPDTEEAENETEFHIALLEIRVKELETLNLGLKKKCDYLESQNNVYKEQIVEVKQEKTDLVTYLQRSLGEEKTNVKELEDRLFGVQEAWADSVKEYERKLAKKDEEFEETKFRLDKHILELTAKLTSLEDFRVQKDKLTAEKEELQMNLVEERKSFELKFEDLENRMIRSRERMKNDALEIITKMAKDVLKAGRLCLTATVRHAIDENIRLKDQVEKCSQENLKLREDLQNISDTLRTKRMTLEVLEEENALVHKKCLQFRRMVTEFAERQRVLDIRIKSVEDLEKELLEVKTAHAKCKAAADVEKFRQMVITATEALKKPGVPTQLESLKQQVRVLQDTIIQMAIAAKDMTEAADPEESAHLKDRFWTMLVKLYETACDLPNLPSEVKKKLIVNVPKVTAYIKR